jgi:hypothetical protein
MSKQTFAGLTLEELSAAGAEAGRRSVKQAHNAGVAASGITRLRFADGSQRNALTWLHSDGTLEIRDHDIGISSQAAVAESGAGRSLQENYRAYAAPAKPVGGAVRSVDANEGSQRLTGLGRKKVKSLRGGKKDLGKPLVKAR